jgi:hypothetical protein
MADFYSAKDLRPFFLSQIYPSPEHNDVHTAKVLKAKILNPEFSQAEGSKS